MNNTIPHLPMLLLVPTEEAMQHFLDALNVSGASPELACVSGRMGSPFLASLTEPDAAHVEVTSLDENGQKHCCECQACDRGQWCSDRWQPTYPVNALVTKWPDLDRVADNDFIEPWWVCPQSNGCLPGCECDKGDSDA